MNLFQTISRQLYGAKYEGISKSLTADCVLFFALYAAGIRLVISPFVLYLASTVFTASIMWQILRGNRFAEILQGMLAIPFENKDFIFSSVFALTGYTLITKTLTLWVLFFAVSPWKISELITALLCGVHACLAAAAVFLLYQKQKFLPFLFGIFCIPAVPFLVRSSAAVLAAALSGSPDLERSIRALPGQKRRFCCPYCLFLSFVNFFILSIYLFSWQFTSGGIHITDIGSALLFSILNAALSVFLEWFFPIRNWKTESGLWHHPRKYAIPLFLMLLIVWMEIGG